MRVSVAGVSLSSCDRHMCLQQDRHKYGVWFLVQKMKGPLLIGVRGGYWK